MISFSPASSAALRSKLLASAMAADVTRYFLAMDISVSPVSTRWRRQLTHLSGGISAISAENFCAVPSGRRNSNEGSSGVETQERRIERAQRFHVHVDGFRDQPQIDGAARFHDVGCDRRLRFDLYVVVRRIFSDKRQRNNDGHIVFRFAREHIAL